ncbi:hypothetical protein AB4043_16615, partial [Terriglobus sp. YAF25]
LVASFGYQLPWGIMSSGILTLRSATPFSAYAATVNADSVTQYVPGTTRNQVNRDVDFSLINTYRASRGLAAVDPSTVQNSAYKSFDLRLLKNFRIHDRFSLEVYGQAFNLFGANNYLYNSITTSAASATFGRATDSGNRQQGELAARFTF